MYLFVHTRWAHLYLAHINTSSSFIYSNTYQPGPDPFFFPSGELRDFWLSLPGENSFLGLRPSSI
jgi:hypothetical protein